MSTHSSFLAEQLGKKKWEPGIPGFQCVAFDKFYAWEVLGIKLGTFGGNAFSGWENLSKTFTAELFERFIYTPGMIPQQSDFLFYKKSKANKQDWHTSVAHSATQQAEQNGGAGTASGEWSDAIRISNINFSQLLGWYRLKPKYEKAIEDRVARLVKKLGLKEPSRTQPYTAFEFLIVLSKLDELTSSK